MRLVLRVLRLALLGLVIVTVVAACRILRYDAAPAVYPPPPDAITSAQAQATAARIAGQATVDREDLSIDFAPSRASSVALYVDGQNFFPAMLADVQAAQSSIHFEVYGFNPGSVADQFVPVLKAKAQQGIPVRIIVDRLGSHVDTGSADMYHDLSAAGVQVIVNYPYVFSRVGPFDSNQTIDWRFQQLLHFHHRKLFVIDGQVAWIGGAGLEDYFYDGSFHDVFVRYTGDAVAQMQLAFLTMFRFHGGALPSGPGALDRYFPLPAQAGSIPATLVANTPGEQHLPVSDAIWNLIDGARGRLDIIDPYVADTGTIRRIIEASKRGVKVRFIVPARSNSPPVQWAFEHHYQDLADAGVAVYLHDILPHAKVVLADDRVLVGSTNLDSWALYRNWETSIIFEDAQVAEAFERQLFDPDVAVSTPATPPTGLWRLVDAVAFLFSPLL